MFVKGYIKTHAAADTHSTKRTPFAWLAGLALAGLVSAVLVSPFAAAPAEAQTYRGTGILQDQTELERLTNAYEEIKAQMGEVDAQIAQIEAQIPAAQERAQVAAVAQYKNQRDWISLVCALLEADTLGDYLRQVDRIEHLAKTSQEAMGELRDLKAQAEELRSQIAPSYDAAASALRVLQDQRASRQSAAVSRAVSQANMLGGEASVGVAADGGKQPDDYREAATTDTAALRDGADWYADRDEFITHWAARIDAYLAGSPLEGQGANFAQAAWKYNVDPRWSPAISNTESSKGRACIRPHNAWGWGAADADPYGLALEWNSWEEAIDAHVKGLSEGYGYTISMVGARTYCPNTWQSWYNKTLAEMSRI